MKQELMKIELLHPIPIKNENGNAEICNEVVFERLKTKHLKFLPDDIENMKPKEVIPLIASMAGLTEDEAGEIDLVDLVAICEKLNPLLEGLQFLPSGKK